MFRVYLGSGRHVLAHSKKGSNDGGFLTAWALAESPSPNSALVVIRLICAPAKCRIGEAKPWVVPFLHRMLGTRNT